MQHISQVCRLLRHGTRMTVDSQKFHQLSKQKSDISAHTLRFDACGDIHPMTFPKGPSTKILWFDGCNKNFTYYWLAPSLWPNLQFCILDTRVISELYRALPHMFPKTVFFLSEAEFRSHHGMIPCDRIVPLAEADWRRLLTAWLNNHKVMK